MTYNGWKNWETWNVALHINNDQGLYNLSRSVSNYKEFCEILLECNEGRAIAYQTPDGVAWNDSGLDYDALEGLIKENQE